MKKIAVIMAIFILLEGCSSGSNKQMKTDVTTINNANKTEITTSSNAIDVSKSSKDNSPAVVAPIDLMTVKGNWASSPKSQIFSLNYELGGILMKVTESNLQYIKGELMQIQSPPSNRIANISFNGKIEDNSLQFDYNDDGFGSSGSCKISIISNS
ncbi:MAG TPA: hypothetical protein VF941_18685, partial [Clostridia bacterium]